MYQLIKFTKKDIPHLLSWITDARSLLVWSGAGYNHPLDKNQLEKTINRSKDENLKYYLFKFILDNVMVGYIELKIIDPIKKIARIGRIIIDPNFRKRGLGSELIIALKKYVLKHLDINTLTLGVFSFNQAAIALYDKSDFIITETKNNYTDFDGEKWDLVIMDCELQ